MKHNVSSSDEPILYKVHHLLSEHNLTVAVAESCTGGLLCEHLTKLAGSSNIFVGGIVSYSNQVKTDLLGVSAETLEQFGAVSENTARAMITGLSDIIKADIYLAITGIAGPGGGSKAKPIGTVYIATKFKEQILCNHYIFEGDREQIRQITIKIALQIIYDFFDIYNK